MSKKRKIKEEPSSLIDVYHQLEFDYELCKDNYNRLKYDYENLERNLDTKYKKEIADLYDQFKIRENELNGLLFLLKNNLDKYIQEKDDITVRMIISELPLQLDSAITTYCSIRDKKFYKLADLIKYINENPEQKRYLSPNCLYLIDYYNDYRYVYNNLKKLRLEEAHPIFYKGKKITLDTLINLIRDSKDDFIKNKEKDINVLARILGILRDKEDYYQLKY